jgi:hypothetical protein
MEEQKQRQKLNSQLATKYESLSHSLRLFFMLHLDKNDS